MGDSMQLITALWSKAIIKDLDDSNILRTMFEARNEFIKNAIINDMREVESFLYRHFEFMKRHIAKRYRFEDTSEGLFVYKKDILIAKKIYEGEIVTFNRL